MYDYEEEYKGYLLKCRDWIEGPDNRDGKIYTIFVYDKTEWNKTEQNKNYRPKTKFTTNCFLSNQSLINMNNDQITQIKNANKNKLIIQTKSKIYKNDLTDKLDIAFR